MAVTHQSRPTVCRSILRMDGQQCGKFRLNGLLDQITCTCTQNISQGIS